MRCWRPPNTSTRVIVFNSAVQEAIPNALRGRAFTLLDITWNAARLLSLVAGGLIVDLVGIRPLYFAGGALLVLAGALGLRLLGRPQAET